MGQHSSAENPEIKRKKKHVGCNQERDVAHVDRMKSNLSQVHGKMQRCDSFVSGGVSSTPTSQTNLCCLECVSHLYWCLGRRISGIKVQPFVTCLPSVLQAGVQAHTLHAHTQWISV